MREQDREQLRATFNEDAARYDRVRPGYPAQLFSDLAMFAGIGPGVRVLEIGCGTGQFTLPWLRTAVRSGRPSLKTYCRPSGSRKTGRRVPSWKRR